MHLLGIPMPPSLNNAYPSNKSGRRFKSKEYSLWEKDFGVWAFLNPKTMHEARLLYAGNKQKLELSCLYVFNYKRVICKDGTSKKLDLDNRAKPLLDAVTKAIGFDDSVIWKLTLLKATGEREYCNVELNEYLELGIT